MKKLNVDLLKTLSSTFASCHYKAEVDKCVRKARVANETLANAITNNGGKVYALNEPNPFASIAKESVYTISMGAKLNYKRKVEALTKRNGVVTTYHSQIRDLGMFPVFNELFYVANGFDDTASKGYDTIYIRAYQASLAKSTYFANGKPIAKVLLGQFLPSDDYKTLSGLEKNKSVVTDKGGNVIYCQDEDGNVILENGKPKEMQLPELRSIKLSNVEIFRKKEKLNFFLDEDWSVEDLRNIRKAHYTKMVTITENEISKLRAELATLTDVDTIADCSAEIDRLSAVIKKFQQYAV